MGDAGWEREARAKGEARRSRRGRSPKEAEVLKKKKVKTRARVTVAEDKYRRGLQSDFVPESTLKRFLKARVYPQISFLKARVYPQISFLKARVGIPENTIVIHRPNCS